MARLIKFIFTGSWHEHTWETEERVRIYSRSKYDDTVGCTYVLRCSECGSAKVKRVTIF